MVLLKNMLAIFGVLILAFNTAGEANEVVALSKQIAFIFENWGDLVRDIWREICTRLGLPVIDLLARPFSFLIAAIALALSAVVSLSQARDAFFDKACRILTDETDTAAPNPDRAARTFAIELESATRLSLFTPSGKRVLPWDTPGYRMDLSAGYVFIVTGFFALLDVRDFTGLVWIQVISLAIPIWILAYVMPFTFCAVAAGKIGERFWPTESGRKALNSLFLLQQDHPNLARDLRTYRVAIMTDDLNVPDTATTDELQTRPNDERNVIELPLFEAMEQMVPNSFFERTVYAKMWERLLASLLVVLAIYVVSYAIIIAEAVGIISV